jgi:prephenate dehydrogenase
MAALTRGPVAIVGLGVIGGSLARALQARGVAVRGCSARTADVALAREAGIPARPSGRGGIAAVAAGAPVVVLAVPVSALAAAAGAALGAAPDGALIVHASSLQDRRALRLDQPAWRRVLGTHPMAGAAASGFAHARADLFAGCTVSIESRGSRARRDEAAALWRMVGAGRIVHHAAGDHDRLMTWVSHLPQLAATALAATLAEAGIAPAALGPGGRDATRLATSPLAMWEPLLEAAAAADEAALAALQRVLVRLGRVLARRDARGVAGIWEAARRWRGRADAGRGGTGGAS